MIPGHLNDLLTQLRGHLNTRVKLAFRDGEIVIGQLDLVLEDKRAIVFDLVTSNRPDKYEKSDKRPHIFADISDVIWCEPAE